MNGEGFAYFRFRVLRQIKSRCIGGYKCSACDAIWWAYQEKLK